MENISENKNSNGSGDSEDSDNSFSKEDGGTIIPSSYKPSVCLDDDDDLSDFSSNDLINARSNKFKFLIDFFKKIIDFIVDLFLWKKFFCKIFMIYLINIFLPFIISLKL